MSFNLARCYSKEATGLYPRLVCRGEEIIRQGIDAGIDEHTIWLDWRALITEAITNPDFDTRRKFFEAYAKVKACGKR